MASLSGPSRNRRRNWAAGATQPTRGRSEQQEQSTCSSSLVSTSGFSTSRRHRVPGCGCQTGNRESRVGEAGLTTTTTLTGKNVFENWQVLLRSGKCDWSRTIYDRSVRRAHVLECGNHRQLERGRRIAKGLQLDCLFPFESNSSNTGRIQQATSNAVRPEVRHVLRSLCGKVLRTPALARGIGSTTQRICARYIVETGCRRGTAP